MFKSDGFGAREPQRDWVRVSLGEPEVLQAAPVTLGTFFRFIQKILVDNWIGAIKNFLSDAVVDCWYLN